MSKFNPGDRVIVDNSFVATIKTYDEATGQLVLERNAGGGTDTVYGPISVYHLERLVSEAVTEPAEEETPAASDEDEGPKDQITTSGFGA